MRYEKSHREGQVEKAILGLGKEKNRKMPEVNFLSDPGVPGVQSMGPSLSN